jgi:RNA polymerase sigma-70 factor (ECF subfamily)
MRDEQSALDGLVREHLPAAIRFAVRLTGSVDEAEDVTQDALLKVVRNWSTYRGDAPFRTWFFRIVINAFRDHLTLRDADAGGVACECIDVRQRPADEILATRELGQLIGQRVSQLPPRQREVLVLITYEGIAAAQVAVMLDMTTDNVYATLHLARRRLREQLRPYLDSTSHDPRRST